MSEEKKEEIQAMTSRKPARPLKRVKVKTITDLSYTDKEGNVIDVGIDKIMEFLENSPLLKVLLDNKCVEVVKE